MSIIKDEYKGKYRGASDWVGEFINANCKADESKGDKGHFGIDLAKVAELAKANGLDPSHLKTETSSDKSRYRMTVGNMLRAAAKKRHGLLDIKGKKVSAPPEFFTKHGLTGEATEDMQGKKLKAAASVEKTKAEPKSKAEPKAKKAA